MRAKPVPCVDLPGEEWRPLVGIRGYDVSNFGRVRSWVGRWTKGAAMLRNPVPATKRGGYLTLSFIVDGKYVLRFVHHLVLEAFKGAKPDGQEARHLNGNETDNAATNLEWGTHTENVADQARHGTDSRGERNGRAVLTQAQADEIRASDERGVVIARRYGISQATVSNIRNGHIYVGKAA